MFSSNFEQKIFFSKYFFRIFKFFHLIFFCRFFTSLRGQNHHLGGDLNFFSEESKLVFDLKNHEKKCFFKKTPKHRYLYALSFILPQELVLSPIGNIVFFLKSHNWLTFENRDFSKILEFFLTPLLPYFWVFYFKYSK